MSRKAAKRRSPRECVYCGRSRPCTDEHVIPRALYPDDSMPPKSEFVIVPACNPCNGMKAKDDTYVRDAFSADIACEGNPIVSSVLPTVFRSVQKNWSHFGRVAIASGRLEPVFSPAGLYLGHRVGVPIDSKRINRFFKLVARGLYWKKFTQRIPDDYVFEVRRLGASAFPAAYEAMMKVGAHGPHVIGNGVFWCIVVIMEENPFITHWFMAFYDSIFITVTTGPFDFIEEFMKPEADVPPPANLT